mgnify:CR=1 FL=1
MMPDWIESILVAIGGGTVVLVGVLTIFKGLLIKLFETGIETSFEKNLVKFQNKLDRSTRAYEILLNREMRFYEKLELLIAELVPLEHDLLYYLEQQDNWEERERVCDAFKSHFLRYLELMKILKNENLVHQSYTPKEVFEAFSTLVIKMQDNCDYWKEMCTYFFDGNYDRIDYDKGKKTVDELLLYLALAETSVQKRLKLLSGEI